MGLLVPPVPRALVANVKRGLLKISPSEFRVARLLLAAKTNDEIAEEMAVSGRTVETHILHLLAKCACTRREFVLAAHQLDEDPVVTAYLLSLPNHDDLRISGGLMRWRRQGGVGGRRAQRKASVQIS